MKKGFTLIELVIAIALLAMALGFSGIVFKVSTEMHRTSGANAEIMQKLRAITDQLNSDFKGLRKDAPLLIRFQEYPADSNQRFDQIMFFADGDFQSTQLYDVDIPSDTGKPIRGNVAKIYYGLGGSFDSYDNQMEDQPFNVNNVEERLLARRQHILSADSDLDKWPDSNNVNGTYNDEISDEFGRNYFKINRYEHDSLSLAKWKTVDRDQYLVIFNLCFNLPPQIELSNLKTLHQLMCEGVGSFSIQWGYWDSEVVDNPQLRWFPGNDPREDGSFYDSHFDLMQPVPPDQKFGVLFNIPYKIATSESGFYLMKEGDILYSTTPGVKKFPSNFYPKALKFTFTLYDSKGIIKNGKTFTHIVYMGE